jgi:hypothetical protein
MGKQTLDFTKLYALVEAMNREGVSYVLFGAMAMAAHGLVRATEDADFFISPEAENVARLKRALHSVWNDPSIDEISAEELAGDYPSVSFFPPGEEFGIDFVVRLGTAYSFDSIESQPGALEDIPLRVVTPRTLYEMKRDTVRYKDRIDAEALRQKFFLDDED